jgi:hypothetical protein
MRCVLLFVAFAVMQITTVHAGRKVPMTGNDLQAAFSDTVLLVDTPLGSRLPVAYGSDGSLAGYSKELAFYLGSTNDKGKWWISGNKLCHKWTKWFEKKLQCLVLHRTDRRLWWRRDDGETGTATLMPVSADTKTADATTSKVATGSVEAKPATAPNGPAPTPATVAAIHKSRYRVIAVASNDVLNVRAEPSAEAPIVGALPHTASGIAMPGPCVEDWCRVKAGQTSGWVNKRYLSPEGSARAAANF